MKKKRSDRFTVVPFEKLKNTKAWKLTSELVRKLAEGRCYTCDAKIPFNKLVAGHFREKRGGSSTYFDLDNLRGQCGWYCNKQKGGNKDIYAYRLIREIGVKRFNNLFTRGQKSKFWTKEELNEIEKERERMLKKLK